ncbi:MAG TPA: hypothetical protein VGD81_08360 [Opitutaceae bacterium]
MFVGASFAAALVLAAIVRLTLERPLLAWMRGNREPTGTAPLTDAPAPADCRPEHSD